MNKHVIKKQQTSANVEALPQVYLLIAKNIRIS